MGHILGFIGVSLDLLGLIVGAVGVAIGLILYFALRKKK